MAKVKMWQPVAEDDLPAKLVAYLHLANGSNPKRRLAVCEQVVLQVEESSSPEITRLKEQVKVLERVLDRKKKEVKVEDVYTTVKAAIRQGQTISCSKQRYPAYREALHKTVAWAIDDKQPIYANIALNEVKRLDRLHDYKGEASGTE